MFEGEIGTFQTKVGRDCITHLRKMRCASFDQLASPHETVPVQRAISDAELLASVASVCLLGSILTNALDNLSALKRQWQATVDPIAEVYQRYNPSSYTGAGAAIHLNHTINSSLPIKLFRYQLLVEQLPDSLDQMQSGESDLLNFSNRRAMPDLCIFDNRLGVISPLSTDYFMHALLQQFIAQFTPFPVFKLKPLILDSNLHLHTSSNRSQYDPEFDAQVDAIAICTDIDNDGSTRQACVVATQAIYFRKLIHGQFSAQNLWK